MTLFEEVLCQYEARGVALGLTADDFFALGAGADGFDAELASNRLGLTGWYGGEILSFGRVVTDADYNAVVSVCEDAFEHATGRAVVEPVIRGARINYAISPVARIGQYVIGAYLLADRCNDRINRDLARIGALGGREPAGCQGVALAIDREWRGLGIGHMWRGLPRRRGCYDYAYGLQSKRLENIDDWMKRRVLVADLPGMYITAEPLTEEMGAAFQKLYGANQPRRIQKGGEVDGSGRDDADQPDLFDLFDTIEPA